MMTKRQTMTVWLWQELLPDWTWHTIWFKETEINNLFRGKGRSVVSCRIHPEPSEFPQNNEMKLLCSFFPSISYSFSPFSSLSLCHSFFVCLFLSFISLLHKIKLYWIGFKVITPVVMKSSILGYIMPCIPLKFNRHFRGTCRLHLQGYITDDKKASNSNWGRVPRYVRELQRRVFSYVSVSLSIYVFIYLFSFTFIQNDILLRVWTCGYAMDLRALFTLTRTSLRELHMFTQVAQKLVLLKGIARSWKVQENMEVSV
jgi:hypothetical protein